MREILFRGKARETGIWVYGSLLVNSANIPLIRERNGVYWYVSDETVGQYTGICDADGRKIFEGDIVQFGGDDGVSDAVSFESGSFKTRKFRLDLGYYSTVSPREMEITGDIFDGEP